MTLKQQIGFIYELTNRLVSDVCEYENACKAAKADGHSDYMYADYISEPTATRAAMKRSILTIRQELVKLSKSL